MAFKNFTWKHIYGLCARCFVYFICPKWHFHLLTNGLLPWTKKQANKRNGSWGSILSSVTRVFFFLALPYPGHSTKHNLPEKGMEYVRYPSCILRETQPNILHDQHTTSDTHNPIINNVLWNTKPDQWRVQSGIPQKWSFGFALAALLTLSVVF